MSWSVSAFESVTVTDSVTATLTPADQDRSWKRRGAEIQRTMQVLTAPRATGMSAEAIHQAAQELMSYFALAYHLKDALKAERPQGLASSDVEQAISGDPRLALLADLANLDKHFVLNQPPRSGDAPQLGTLRSTTLAGGGWQLEMPIQHRGEVIEGIEFAKAVPSVWEAHLRVWGLSP